MTAQPVQPQALRTTEALVTEWLALAEQAEGIAARIDTIKAQLRDALPAGSHEIAGAKVSIRPPSRRFNAANAAKLLTAEQLALCAPSGYDAAKLKGFLSPVLLDTCMDPGSGSPVVSLS